MNILQIMQQAKAMQSKMTELQERLGDEYVTGTASGGAVSITMTCKGRVETVKIQPSAIDPKDREMLEDLVKMAINDARRKGDDRMAEETKRMMEELGLPAGAKLPF